MGGKWLEGRESELVVYRWQYGPEQWVDILKRHGFSTAHAEVLPQPEPGTLGTLLASGRVPD
ncbi:hypothetical protein [Streptomyces odontomachi]|uniref:hypothetical protein n=1 Tax=Streptomyces odontomachi TaxID=2944940 RepID=UPI002109C73A|nr:hypothetical protein [Streptomyces sp. ODS25]